jgi:hypothetical protein
MAALINFHQEQQNIHIPVGFSMNAVFLSAFGC